MTYIGTATVLIEVDGLRILTDPAFDGPGKRYGFGWGLGSRKTMGPALSVDELPPIDLVLLSHDHHADNLDDSGRRFLSKAKTVLTTPSGARRLKAELGERVLGLKPWEQRSFTSPRGLGIEVEAVPSQHYQRPLTQFLVGETTGFVLKWEGQQKGSLYISGDTVYFSGISEIGKRHRIGTAIIHLGGVKFSLTGPLRYTLDGKDSVRLLRDIDPSQVIPIHFDGWSHFKQNLEKSLEEIKKDCRESEIVLLERGQPRVVGV